jgi:DNA-binding response OmpR family regulator
LRRQGLKAPIIVIAQDASEDDVVQALDAGANDFVIGAARFAEIAARIRSQQRSYRDRTDVPLTIGPFVFRPIARQLELKNRLRIRLTEKESALLRFLYRAGGRPVARNTLLREVWGYHGETDTHTVETHIYRLRRKIEAGAGPNTLLLNDEGGYRLALTPAVSAPGPRPHTLDRGDSFTTFAYGPNRTRPVAQVSLVEQGT